MPNRLTQLKLSGFKSIRAADLTLGKLNVLIGANGTGKSNLLNFFSMLNFMLTGSLQLWVGKQGGANAVLHYGTKTTPRVSAELELHTDAGINRYTMNLFHAAGDTLIFGDEQVAFQRNGAPAPRFESLGAGHRESLLVADEQSDNSRVVRFCLSAYRAFQFHDTSETAHLRNNCDLNNNRRLMSDGGNVAAVLYKLKHTAPDYYQRILKTLRQLAPFFQDFILEPFAFNTNQLQLRWKSNHSEYELGPYHLSDGTLRAIALITLLLQPDEDLPDLIVLDEPELGLHPYAVSLIGGLIRTAHTQIILATQSPLFLEQFEPDDVIVTEQQAGQSVFERLDVEKLTEWLEEYSLGELWEKNVIGGRPGR